MVDIWARSSDQIRALCDSLDIKYFHFLQPNLHYPGSKPLSDLEKARIASEKDGLGPIVVQAYPLLIQRGKALAASGEIFDDLSMAFEETDETMYKDGCCHLNTTGYDKIAERVGSFIISQSDRRDD